MAEGRLARFQQKLLAWHKKYFDWLLENVASPTAPLAWLSHLKRPAGAVGWALDGLKWVLVVVWAVAGVGIWFLALWVLIWWETFTPSERRGSAPPAAHHG